MRANGSDTAFYVHADAADGGADIWTGTDVATNDAPGVGIVMASGGALRILCVIPQEGGTKILGAPNGATAIRCSSCAPTSND